MHYYIRFSALLSDALDEEVETRFPGHLLIVVQKQHHLRYDDSSIADCESTCEGRPGQSCV